MKKTLPSKSKNRFSFGDTRPANRYLALIFLGGGGGGGGERWGGGGGGGGGGGFRLLRVFISDIGCTAVIL
jgi:hypothetical protein